MKSFRRYRIFLGAQEIAGMLERLNKAFRDMGIKSDFWCLQNYPFSKEHEFKRIEKRYFYHTKKRYESKTVKEKKHWDILQMIDILLIFIYSLFSYNCYIYIFGHGLFIYNWYLRKNQELEFKILKLFKKDIIMWFCGSDARAPYCDVDIYEGDIDKMVKETERRAQNVQMLEKYAKLIDFASSSHFHSKPYILYNQICVPIDDVEIVKEEKTKNSKVTILHAPSDPEVKGTAIIRKVIKELKDEGYIFDYVEVIGLPHEEVLKKLKNADIVIDQLYTDFPMAGFASEAAANGVPVITAGYYADYYYKVKNNPMIPSIYCLPEELKSKIIDLLQNERERVNIGKQHSIFIKENSMSEIVAKKFLGIFDNSYSRYWLFDPKDNDYIWGCGINRKKIENNITTIIRKYGIESLCIRNQPRLEKKCMKLFKEKD